MKIPPTFYFIHHYSLLWTSALINSRSLALRLNANLDDSTPIARYLTVLHEEQSVSTKHREHCDSCRQPNNSSKHRYRSREAKFRSQSALRPNQMPFTWSISARHKGQHPLALYNSWTCATTPSLAGPAALAAEDGGRREEGGWEISFCCFVHVCRYTGRRAREKRTPEGKRRVVLGKFQEMVQLIR